MKPPKKPRVDRCSGKVSVPATLVGSTMLLLALYTNKVVFQRMYSEAINVSLLLGHKARLKTRLFFIEVSMPCEDSVMYLCVSAIDCSSFYNVHV